MSNPKVAGVSPWQLEFARLFAYPVESPLTTEQHWWEDLAGAGPVAYRAVWALAGARDAVPFLRLVQSAINGLLLDLMGETR